MCWALLRFVVFSSHFPFIVKIGFFFFRFVFFLRESQNIFHRKFVNVFGIHFMNVSLWMKFHENKPEKWVTNRMVGIKMNNISPATEKKTELEKEAKTIVTTIVVGCFINVTHKKCMNVLVEKSGRPMLACVYVNEKQGKARNKRVISRINWHILRNSVQYPWLIKKMV